ncbi:hypothetical protein I0C86_03080 [Plantactinospora sp. S1510]|uniref:MFS transporter n=1 Tax=Plantactinospora alkalitolerans TaxID=2789879 RepID=A0ABS0GP66_9ACTN|nr:hypothetical protein [Plantactinospora alkalitolerans]MBF9127985.1 hypothetical protein [Plantactinospora alkalitolerans]
MRRLSIGEPRPIGTRSTIVDIPITPPICLPFTATAQAGADAGVTAFGIGFGVASLAAPALLADRYGTVGYATIAGVLATPVTLAKAGVPLAAAALLTTTGGYTAVLLAIGGTCVIAAVGICGKAARRSSVTGV